MLCIVGTRAVRMLEFKWNVLFFTFEVVFFTFEVAKCPLFFTRDGNFIFLGLLVPEFTQPTPSLNAPQTKRD